MPKIPTFDDILHRSICTPQGRERQRGTQGIKETDGEGGGVSVAFLLGRKVVQERVILNNSSVF